MWYTIINMCSIPPKKLSIVMTAYNRKKQLLFTLETIHKSTYNNIEIIIVDDCSIESERFDTEHYRNEYENTLFDKLNIHIIRINQTEKTWVNPCIGYNIGLKKATGDIIIIQNAEVCHIGDCISYVANHLVKDDWMTLNCYGLDNFEQNYIIKHVYDTNNSVYDIINTVHSNKIGNSSLFTNNPEGWLNYYAHFFTAYHYFGAIYRDDLVTKMDGGFCEEYKDGTCCDDNDFIKYLIYNNFRFTTTVFDSEHPFVIHQYHEKCDLYGSEFAHYHRINMDIFAKRMKQIKMSNVIDITHEKYMPDPIILP